MKRTKPRPTGRNAEVRILPAVIGVGAILLVLKAGGLAFGANAAEPAAKETAAPAATPATPEKPPLPFGPARAAAQRAAQPARLPPQPTTPVTQAPLPEAAADSASGAAPPAPAALPNGGPDPLAAIKEALPNQPGKPLIGAAAENAPAPENALPDDLSGSGISPAEMDVLTSLSGRRDTLDQRQRELDLRGNVIAAAEKRVDDKISQLKALQATIEKLLGQRDTKQAEQLDGLVRIYTAMKPKDAARIFSTLDNDVRLGVAGRMKPDAMAGIMASLPADVARKMTVELADRYKMTPDLASAAAAAKDTPAPEATPAAKTATPPGG
jgi:flagellar motility protein MotE (MotC chaperone)